MFVVEIIHYNHQSDWQTDGLWIYVIFFSFKLCCYACSVLGNAAFECLCCEINCFIVSRGFFTDCTVQLNVCFVVLHLI